MRASLLLLLSATILFALGPTVLKLLIEMGARLGLDRPDAVSFCNVLFVGNFCAALVTMLYAGPRCIVRELVAVPRRVKAYLLLAAIVSTAYPALLFTALETTSVTNIVLLSRFNGIVYVALGFLLLKESVHRSEILGYSVIAIGVTVMVIANNAGLQIRKGDLYVLAAAVFFGLTEIISRKVLPHVKVPTYVFFRNLVSALIFFGLAIYFYGPEHFMDVFTGELWVLMVVYAALAIVAAQLLWLNAVKVLPVKAVANIQLLNPAFSILFAFVLLNEVPKPMHWLVIGIIVVGMLLPRILHRHKHLPAMHPMGVNMGLAAK